MRKCFLSVIAKILQGHHTAHRAHCALEGPSNPALRLWSKSRLLLQNSASLFRVWLPSHILASKQCLSLNSSFGCLFPIQHFGLSQYEFFSVEGGISLLSKSSGLFCVMKLSFPFGLDVYFVATK